MHKLFLILLALFFSPPAKDKKYIIVAGDITCKACVIQLHSYLHKKVKKENLSIAFRDKGHFIMNEASVSYYKEELPKASFVFFKQEALFPKKERYPYLLQIDKTDTLKVPYDSLFIGDGLSTKFLP